MTAEELSQMNAEFHDLSLEHSRIAAEVEARQLRLHEIEERKRQIGEAVFVHVDETAEVMP